jgi:hypothetical protein
MVSWHHFLFFENGDYSPLYVKWFLNTILGFVENGDYSPLCDVVSQHHPWFCENGDYSLPLYIKWFCSTKSTL